MSFFRQIDDLRDLVAEVSRNPIEHRRIQSVALINSVIGQVSQFARQPTAESEFRACNPGDHDLQRCDRLHQLPNVPVDPVDIQHQLVAS